MLTSARPVMSCRYACRSPTVISSCGALNTPALLLRSGIRGYTGKNLRLHPAVFVGAEFPQVC